MTSTLYQRSDSWNQSYSHTATEAVLVIISNVGERTGRYDVDSGDGFPSIAVEEAHPIGRGETINISLLPGQSVYWAGPSTLSAVVVPSTDSGFDFVVNITGLTDFGALGMGVGIGDEITATAVFTGAEPTGGSWSAPWVVDGGDFRIARYTVQTSDNQNTLVATFTPTGGSAKSSDGYVARYDAPVATGSISNQTLTKDSAEATIVAEVSTLFTGDDRSYGVSGYAGVRLDGNALKIDPTVVASTDTITLTASNSGGAANITFDLTVEELLFRLATIGDGMGRALALPIRRHMTLWSPTTKPIWIAW